MYGAFIGDIVGSKYEFDNIKTKNFPLFSRGCDYTDDTIMTVAVAKAILLSRKEQHDNNAKGRGFQEILIEQMQDFGRRYPNPTGAYGGNFSRWLKQKNPKPYGSYGNGSAMRVSPCALAAVSLEEALALARASAAVTHDHPEGIKGAEAVTAAIFLARKGETKEQIRQYITEHYYPLDFTLDAIRSSYEFDVSCQGSVPQAIVAFLESESFEDAIRNVISIGGDCDTTGAMTGAIAWMYYAGSSNWLGNCDASMQEIKEQAKAYLPQEYIEIEEEFHNACRHRAGVYFRSGFCTPILNQEEYEKFGQYWEEPAARREGVVIAAEMKDAVTRFCRKYVLLMEMLYRDRDLNRWCRTCAGSNKNTEHLALDQIICKSFQKEANKLWSLPNFHEWRNKIRYSLESSLNGTEADLIRGICAESSCWGYGVNGYSLPEGIANGNLYRLMSIYLSYNDRPRYTLDYVKAQEWRCGEWVPGACTAGYRQSMNQWHMKVQLDRRRMWFLSVYMADDGSLIKYTLDEEASCDTHYEFTEEQKIRELLYEPGDEHLYFHEILIRYVSAHGGDALRAKINPYITAQYHYD